MMVLLFTQSQQVNASVVPVLPQSELAIQQRHPKVMPVAYWDAVAICESSLDGSTARWDDGGNWAGGLGIAKSAWKAYGGHRFGRSPDRATREEQIIVANRISVIGFQTTNKYLTVQDRLDKRPFFRYPVGFTGWGCIKNNQYLRPDHWRKHHKKKSK